MINIRHGEKEDSSDIAILWNFYINKTLCTFNSVQKSPKDVEKILTETQKDRRAFLIAEDSSGLIGFSTYFQFRRDMGYQKTMEHSIFVSKSSIRRGIGKALMRGVEENASQRGVHSVFGCVSSENTKAIFFHEAMGFARVVKLQQVRYKFNRFVDLLLFQKFLTFQHKD